ncbi:uncharacterized protein LOC124157498 isoform X2 [Ischnura elegans]|uniref:uncharacterized protein LOC124157498 isoform X2 n=1 Tax=Ischnura elegans TaxID=197161 RepID=UPI001ED86C28|nr:uncharacterized protein LOC124157498 isoform X2 [Ischnura elegans]
MNRICAFRKLLKFNTAVTSRRAVFTYEPEYLQIKGYDFPVLESFQGFIHRTAENMGIEVEDSWATPAQKLLVKKLKHDSSVVDCEYGLTLYERNVQIVDLSSTLGAIFFDVLHEALPEGVKVRIHEHLDEHEEVRYVPDFELIQLKTELETLGGPSKRK